MPQNRDGSVHIHTAHRAGSALPASLLAICPFNRCPLVGSLVARIRHHRIAERCCDCASAEVSTRLTARQQCIIRIIGNQQISPAAGLSACLIRIIPGNIYQVPHATNLSKIPHMPAARPVPVRQTADTDSRNTQLIAQNLEGLRIALTDSSHRQVICPVQKCSRGRINPVCIVAGNAPTAAVLRSTDRDGGVKRSVVIEQAAAQIFIRRPNEKGLISGASVLSALRIPGVCHLPHLGGGSLHSSLVAADQASRPGKCLYRIVCR